MSNVADNAFTFLIQTLFDLYIFILLLRIILQWSGVNYYNPLAQLAAKLTNVPLQPFRRLLRSYHGIDLAALTLLLVLEIIKLFILLWLKFALLPAITGVLILAFAIILNQTITLFLRDHINCHYELD